MQTYEVTQGDIGDLILAGLNDNSAMDGNYTCTVAVQGTTVSRAVTDKSGDTTSFLVQLSTTETAGLRAGTYQMAIKIVNTTLTPVFTKTEYLRLDVVENFA